MEKLSFNFLFVWNAMLFRRFPLGPPVYSLLLLASVEQYRTLITIMVRSIGEPTEKI